jgi:predicted small secreted protein
MRLLVVIVAVFALNSCNTCIGIGRDTKAAFGWTKNKIEGSGDAAGNELENNYGAPVY